MKKIVLIAVTMFFVFGSLTGCGQKRAKLNPGATSDLVVLTMKGNLGIQEVDVINEFERVLTWMDRDIIDCIKIAGLNAPLIKAKRDYNAANGDLLVIDVDAFNAGSRAMRIWVGYGAGAASLDLDYKLKDKKGVVLKEWKDGVGSSKGGTYCAQTLNVNAINTLVEYYNN